ncbi:hypothetical protein K1T71_008518 [Dendrolimus kikuchii]|uniref:Uncharacterized protein n=1 Tax=Dendrolimus kikuchii TaxID=765133 RepID=A0ACC1CXA9_9NEOP|nr:hypothetical protein K1T71_008518 [Dendrolimus kikuchii]
MLLWHTLSMISVDSQDHVECQRTSDVTRILIYATQAAPAPLHLRPPTTHIMRAFIVFCAVLALVAAAEEPAKKEVKEEDRGKRSFGHGWSNLGGYGDYSGLSSGYSGYSGYSSYPSTSVQVIPLVGYSYSSGPTYSYSQTPSYYIAPSYSSYSQAVPSYSYSAPSYSYSQASPSYSYSAPSYSYVQPAQPAQTTRVVAENKIVNVQKVVEVPQVVNVKKVVSVPQVYNSPAGVALVSDILVTGPRTQPAAMKAFLCLALLIAAAAAAPAPEQGKRDKRGFIGGLDYYGGLGYGYGGGLGYSYGLGYGLGYDSLGYGYGGYYGSPLISHAPIVTAVAAPVVVKKVVSVPKVVAVNKIYAPSYGFSSGWW